MLFATAALGSAANMSDGVKAIFKGVRPGIVGMLAATLLSVSSTSVTDTTQFIIAGSVFVSIAYLNAPPIFALGGAALVALFAY
jgi:chromate transport protein ChrA